MSLQSIMKSAPKLPFRELDLLVKAIGECKSKAEEDRIISAEVDTLKQRLSDPRLDKSRGREYMVRVMYCEMLGHDASFAFIPALQLASDPNLLTKKAAYLALTQLLDYHHELVLLLVNTLLVDLKADNFVVVASALVVTTKLIGPDLINAVLPLVIERLSHPRESVRKKAIMALHHFSQMDPQRNGPMAGVEVERHLRTALCDKEPSVMAAALNALQAVAATNPAPFRQLIPSLASILKQVVEHRLPKAYDYHRFPAPFIQIKLLKLLRLLGVGDKAASDNMAAVVGQALRRAAAGGSHTIGHAIVYEAIRTITEIHPNPQLLAAAAEAVAGLLRSSSHNFKYCGLTALAAISRVSPAAAQEHQVAVIDCLDDPDDTLKIKTLGLLVSLTKANNVQVVVERLMAFLRSPACADELLKRRVAGQVVELAEKYAPDTTWFLATMAEVFEVGGEVLAPQLSHNLCRLVAEGDGQLQGDAVALFLGVLDRGTATTTGGGAAAAGAAVLPEVLLVTICWVLGEYGMLAARLPPPHRATPGQVIDKLCAAVASAQASPTSRAYLVTAVTKLAAAAQQQGQRPVLTPDGEELLVKCGSSSLVELQQRATEARALLRLPAGVLAAVLPPDASCEEVEPAELEGARSLAFLEGYVSDALAAGAKPYNPPPELVSGLLDDEDLESLGLPGSSAATAHHHHGKHPPHALRFNAYEPAAAPAAATAASAAGGAFGSSSFASPAPAAAAAAAAAAGGTSVQQQQQPQQYQLQQPPQPQLKGASRGRWGPTEFSSSSSAAAGAAASMHAPPPPAAAAAAAAGSGKPGGGSSSSSSPQPRALTEKDRLAASLFGGGGGGVDSRAAGAGRFGVRSPSPNKPPGGSPKKAAAAVAPLVDLLGDDVDVAPPAAAAAAASGGGGSSSQQPRDPMDLLMGLDDPTPAPAAAAVAAPAAAPAAAAGGGGGPFDLLGDLAAPPPPAAAPAAAAGTAGKPLLDLDALLDAPPPPVLLPGGGGGDGGAMAGAGLAAGGGVPGLLQRPMPAAGNAAMRPQPAAKAAATALVNDPFKDLLG